VLHKGELDQAEVVEGHLLVAGSDSATLLEPTNTLLGCSAVTVPVAIIGAGTTRLGLTSALARRNTWFAATLAQPVANTTRIVPAVGNYPPWPPAAAPKTRQTYLFEPCFGLGDFLRLPSSEPGIERQSLAVAQEVDFGRAASDCVLKGVVCGLFSRIRPPVFRAPAAARCARTTVPSSPHWSESIRPSSSSLR